MSTKVLLEGDESIEIALKKFRRKVQQDQILKEAKAHEFHRTKMQKFRARKLKNHKKR